jgi:hypothetical protein
MNKIFSKNKILALLLLVSFIAMPSFVLAGKNVKQFKIPDIKDDFCGVNINFQYCKCAFHDKHCEAIGLDKGAANTYVQNEYKKWLIEKLAAFANNCINNNGGIWDKNKRTCTIKKDQKLPDGPFNADCSVSQTKFNKNWEKYSDFDKRININDASWEVKQFDKTLDNIADKIAQVDQMEYEMELDRLMRLELRDYKKALVQNIRNNITKSIFRLTWMTYNIVKPLETSHAISRLSENSVAKLFTAETGVEKIGAALKFIQSGVPKGSRAEINTKPTTGKIKSIALNATLGALESAGSPKSVALQVYKDLTGTTMAAAGVPKLEFTKEEVAILRDQHLTNQVVNEILADSYKENAEKRIEIMQLKKDISELYNKLQKWKNKEYNRVKDSLEQSCKDELKK